MVEAGVLEGLDHRQVGVDEFDVLADQTDADRGGRRVDTIDDLLGKDIKAIHGPERPRDIKHSRADNSRAREMLGFDVLVSFREGLARTINYYRDAPEA